jgi:hypothetical protein
MNAEQNELFEVQLAIYDLSKGMARTLSAQFLGPNHAIDIIPHTAILAFGKEYYFGMSGIEASDPHHFRSTRGIYPIEIQFLGHTNVSKDEFEEWCMQHMQKGVYAPHSYDLFQRNCNDFSHHAATEALRLNSTVPDWILSVPQTVLASPMGQMIRPILQQMQITPSGDERSTLGTNSEIPNGNKSVNDGKATATNASDFANPWGEFPSRNVEQSHTSSSVPKDSSYTSEKSSPTTVVLDSFNRPLISNDTNMVNLCIGKIKNDKAVKCLDENTRLKLLESLKVLPHILACHDVRMGLNPPSELSTLQIAREQVQILSLILVSKEATATAKTYALMLIRLLVLQKGIDSNTLLDTMIAMRPFIADKSLKATTRAMAWCVLSNALGSAIESGQRRWFSEEIMQSFVDLATDNISGADHVDVRRGAAAFLYNLALFLNDKKDSDSSRDLSDLQVTILCGVIEAVMDEIDVEVSKRIMLAVGKIIKPYQKINGAAATLLLDLGYIETLQAVRRGKIVSQQASGTVIGELANEIMETIRSQKI